MNKFIDIKASRDSVIANVPANQLHRLKLLEAKYGRLLYVPLDIPLSIDGPAFKTWYMNEAIPIRKLKKDVAGGSMTQPVFLSIDSTRAGQQAIWEQKVVQDVPSLFSGIGAFLDALPFNDRPPFSIWSSIALVPPHRDQGPWFDMPYSFRGMLHDENPEPTLRLIEDPIRPPLWPVAKRLPNVSNAFAWNNLRALHASSYDRRYRKMLLIVHTTMMLPDPDRYEDLIERSLSKYGDHAIISSATIADFLPREAP